MDLDKNSNNTIDIDEWSIQPFSNCGWKSELVNFNDKRYYWVHNLTFQDWVVQNPNLHIIHIDLISEFEEIP